MPDLTPVLLSGSTNGRNIKVAATATPGTLIHTSTATTGELDEVWLWAINTDTVTRQLTIEYGGTTAPDDLLQINLPPKSGDVLVLAGKRINGGVIVRGFSAAANVINVSGNVNRYTP